MARSLFVAVCLVFCFSLSVPAYTVVLKDGRRFEAQKSYRMVNDVVIFQLADGKRFSVSVRNIDVSATELANHQDSGEFVRSAGSPLPITDSEPSAANPSVASNGRPSANSKPRITRKLVNSDFETSRHRKDDSGSSPNSASNPALAVPKAPELSSPPEPVDARKMEAYWQQRARPLLTELAVQEELVAILQAQLDDMAANARTGTNYDTIRTSPGIVLGRNGGIYTPGSTIIVPNNDRVRREDEESKVRERLREAQLQLTAVQIRYNALLEEARKAGVPPGWVR